jgi:hypothetical protein
MLEPWDRLPDESTKAFDAFQVYLKLGGGRSLDACSRAIKWPRTGHDEATKGHKRPGNFGVWSDRYAWVSRAAAWDRHVADAQTRALEEAALNQAKDKADRWITRADQFSEQVWSAFAWAANRLNKAVETEQESRKPGSKVKPLSASAAAAAMALFKETLSDTRAILAINVPTSAAPAGAMAASPGWTQEEAAAGIRAALELRRKQGGKPK